MDQPSVNRLRCIFRNDGLEAVISEYYLDVLDCRRERSTVMAVFFTFHLFGDQTRLLESIESSIDGGTGGSAVFGNSARRFRFVPDRCEKLTGVLVAEEFD